MGRDGAAGRVDGREGAEDRAGGREGWEDRAGGREGAEDRAGGRDGVAGRVVGRLDPAPELGRFDVDGLGLRVGAAGRVLGAEPVEGLGCADGRGCVDGRVLGRLGVDGRVVGWRPAEGRVAGDVPLRGVGDVSWDGRVRGVVEVLGAEGRAGRTIVASGTPRASGAADAASPDVRGGVRTGRRELGVVRRCRVGLGAG